MTTRPALVLVAFILGLAALRPLWTTPTPTPGKIPAHEAAPWMVDCLPQVGSKRLEAALHAVRSGTWEALPRQAKPAAWFISPQDAGQKTP